MTQPGLRLAHTLLGVLSAGLTGALLFLIAGRTDIPMFWAVTIATGILFIPTFALMDPSLVKERMKPGPGGRDQVMIFIAKILLIATIIIAALDVGRHEWSATIPFVVQIVGLAAYVVGMGVVVWSVLVNRFFSSVVRLQEDRGHTLITAGPYGIVRHPGYAGLIIGMPGFGLALGSWLGVIPVALFCLLVMRRLLIEDVFLREQLAGYKEYSKKVRYRLVPHLW